MSDSELERQEQASIVTPEPTSGAQLQLGSDARVCGIKKKTFRRMGRAAGSIVALSARNCNCLPAFERRRQSPVGVYASR